MQILRDALVLGCGREHDARQTANMLASTRACETGEEECEAVLEQEQSGTLPSTGGPEDVYLATQKSILNLTVSRHELPVQAYDLLDPRTLESNSPVLPDKIVAEKVACLHV